MPSQTVDKLGQQSFFMIEKKLKKWYNIIYKKKD